MRKSCCILLCLMLIFTFAGCRENTAPDGPGSAVEIESTEGINYYFTTDTDEVWSDDGVIVSNSSFESIHLVDERYPELAKTLEEINEKIRNSCIQGMNQGAELAIENEEYLQEYWYGPYCDDARITVKRSDSNVFSMEVYDYTDLGGAHPSHYTLSYNIDTMTGDIITLKELVYDEVLLKDAVEADLIAQGYSDDYFYTDLETELGKYAGTGKEADFNFTICPYGVEIFFNPYDIAPYAAGVFTAFVPFEGNDFLNEQYAALPADNIIPIYSYGEYKADFDGDGTLESKFSVEYDIEYPNAEYDDYSTQIYHTLRVIVDDDEVIEFSLDDVDTPMNAADTFFMQTAYGESYIIVQGSDGSESGNLVVCQIYAENELVKGNTFVRNYYPAECYYTCASDFIKESQLEDEIKISM